MKNKMVPILALALAAVLTGCAGTPGAPADTITGTVEENLAAVVDGANAKLLTDGERELAPAESMIVTADTAESVLGLSAEDFEQYVTEASVSQAVIGTFAQKCALLKCPDASAAAEVKQKVTDGFDPNWLVCVVPDKCAVVESGSWVFVTANLTAAADALLESFADLAGETIGSPTVFFERGEGSEETAGGGLLPR